MTGQHRDSAGPVAREVLPRAFLAGRWAVASEALGRLAPPLVLVVLARILMPDDFGMVAVAAIVVSFAQTFWESGLAKALIQSGAGAAELNRAATTVFWANLLLALALYAAVFAGAAWIAAVFGDARIAPLVRVQGIAIVLLALGSVPAAMLQRALKYRPIFLSRLAAAVAPGVIGLPMALMGAGYWALAAGSLAGAALQAVVLLGLSDWKPGWSWSPGALARLANFGAWSAGEAILSWGIMWLDAIVVGVHLSSRELGLYRTGDTAVRLAFGLIIGALMPVLFSALARLQANQPALDAAFRKAVKGVALAAMLLAALAAAAPAELSEIAFGGQWRAMGPVVLYLSVTHGVSWLVGPNAELYRAQGRPDLNLKISAACLLFYTPVFLWAVRHGLELFLQARLAVAMAAFVIHVVVAWRVAGFTPRQFAGSVGWFVLAGAAGAAAGAAARHGLEAPLLMRTAIAVAACLAVFAAVAVRERRFVFDLWRQMRQGGGRHVAAD